MGKIRLVGPLLLAAHLLAKIIFPRPQLFLDLIFYNLIAIAIAIAVGLSPKFNDRRAKYAVTLAMVLWTTGALLSSYKEFFTANHISSSIINGCYLIFYPLVLVGLTRALRTKHKLGSVEVLDAMILGIGLSALGTALFISPILPKFDGDVLKTFFAVLFPIADLVLLALVLSLIILSPLSSRNLLVCLGVVIYTGSDFLFLWLSVHRQYSLGSLYDDGWLIGLVLIAEGFWHHGSESNSHESIHPIFIALSVLLSATLLAITSLRPGYLPNFILIPTIATLLLAFIRMTIALRQSRFIGEERLLARTDELTGLPNRRKFITELDELMKAKDGALLLLDLDEFKPINDLYGHEVGDQLLKQVSTRFTRALPQGSLLARLGGDEFGAIVHGNYEATLEVAHALRATLSYPFSISGREIHVGVSVGHVGNDGTESLLRRADNAMYQAKHEGSGVWSEPEISVQNF
jgi:diguanylate cyclase (GGDEF)-like protein